MICIWLFLSFLMTQGQRGCVHYVGQRPQGGVSVSSGAAWLGVKLKKRQPLFWFMSLPPRVVHIWWRSSGWASPGTAQCVPTYNMVFDSEVEWRQARLPLPSLCRNTVNDRLRSFLPSAAATALPDVDWWTVHTLPIEAKHVITQTMLCPFLPSACPPPPFSAPPSSPSSSADTI